MNLFVLFNTILFNLDSKTNACSGGQVSCCFDPSKRNRTYFIHKIHFSKCFIFFGPKKITHLVACHVYGLFAPSQVEKFPISVFVIKARNLEPRCQFPKSPYCYSLPPLEFYVELRLGKKLWNENEMGILWSRSITPRTLLSKYQTIWGLRKIFFF